MLTHPNEYLYFLGVSLLAMVLAVLLLLVLLLELILAPLASLMVVVIAGVAATVAVVENVMELWIVDCMLASYFHLERWQVEADFLDHCYLATCLARISF